MVLQKKQVFNMKQNTTRRTFPIEFKQQAVELALASGDIL